MTAAQREFVNSVFWAFRSVLVRYASDGIVVVGRDEDVVLRAIIDRSGRLTSYKLKRVS